MDRLVVRLLRLLGQRLGWARMLFVVQHETGKVAWSVTPEDLPLSVRVNTDYSLSVTLGHRDPGDSFLADLETLLESRAANQGAHGARTGAQAVRSDRGGMAGQGIGGKVIRSRKIVLDPASALSYIYGHRDRASRERASIGSWMS